MKSQTELYNRFRDKTYRHTYADSFLNSYLASQIRTLRQARKLSQADLARLVKTKQPRVSLLESADNSTWNLGQLKKLAKAFDVALVVRFESFSNLILEIDRFSRESLARPSFDEEPAFTSGVFVEGPAKESYGTAYLDLAGVAVQATALSVVPTRTTAGAAVYRIKSVRRHAPTEWDDMMSEPPEFIPLGR